MTKQIDMQKRCPTCSKSISHHLFYKNKCHKDGLSSECKSCQTERYQKKLQEKAKTRQPYGTNKTEVLGGVLGKVCFRCKTFKSTSEYFKHSRNHSGLEGSCKSCTLEDKKAASKKHFEAHHETVLKKRSDYVATNYERVATKRRTTRMVEVETLHPRYVKKLLKLPKKQITQHLIDLKTQALQIKRIVKDISTTLKKGNS